MSIFLKIAKIYLETIFQKYCQKSKDNDLSYFSVFRDTELSKTKRKITKELMNDIKNLPNQANDVQSKHLLTQLLESAKNKAQSESSKKSCKIGDFGDAKDLALNFLSELYNTFETLEKNHETLQFINIEYNENDPFSIFHFYVAAYIAAKVLVKKAEEKNHSLWSTIKNLWHEFAEWSTLADEKQTLAIKSLASCSRSINRADKRRQDFTMGCIETVEEALELLQRNNDKLVKSKPYKLKIPLMAVFFAKLQVDVPVIGPSLGELEVCIQTAMKKVSALKETLVNNEQEQLIANNNIQNSLFEEEDNDEQENMAEKDNNIELIQHY